MNLSNTSSKRCSPNKDEQETAVALSQNNPIQINDKKEDSSDEEDSDDKKERAPLELLAEFLKAVMDQDYKTAQNLCKMILLYEPENPEAKEFSQLIEKMLQQENEQDTSSEDSEETNEESSSSYETDDEDSKESSAETSESENEAED